MTIQTKIAVPVLMLFSIAGASASSVSNVSGEVDVVGQVTASCLATSNAGVGNPNGGSTSLTFSGAINLGELSRPDGLLNTDLTGGPVSISIVCNGSLPHVSLSATSLVGSVPPPASSYTNVVGYTARLHLVEVAGSEDFTAVSAVSAPPVTTGVLTSALSGANDNVNVSVESLTSNGMILTAGSYGTPGGTGGVIAITISPV